MPTHLHPHYDEAGVVYDGGFFYSDGLPDVQPTPTPKNKKRMAKISAGLSKLKPAQLVALADLVTSKVIPIPPATPTLPVTAAKITATLTPARDQAEADDDAYEAAKAALVQLRIKRDNSAKKLADAHRAVIATAEGETEGDAEQLASTGYPLASDTPTPSVEPGKIQDLVLTEGDNSGSIDGAIDPEPNSETYEWQITTVHPVDGPYVTVAHSTISSQTISGQTPGQRVWIRVRGIGPGGTGPWSDPATRIVP